MLFYEGTLPQRMYEIWWYVVLQLFYKHHSYYIHMSSTYHYVNYDVAEAHEACTSDDLRQFSLYENYQELRIE